MRSFAVRAGFAVALSLAIAAGTAHAARLEIQGRATLFLPDVVSTPYSEIRAAVSPDGASVLWGSTDRPGGPGGWDIWIARRTPRGWTAPSPVAFDTPAKEFDPAFSPDGRTVYFFSNRPGGFGGDDIWAVSFDPATAAFGTPENLGDAVNSRGDEWAPTATPDGRGLLFASDGRGGQGRHDLFVSALRGGAWQTAQPLPGEVNSAADDFDAAFVAGGAALVFARSDDVENAPIALWAAVRDGDRYVHPQRLDARINVDGGWILGPSLDPAHSDTLLFSGHRPNSQRGKADIHAIRFRLR